MRIADLIDRDGAACVWCGRAPWREDLSVEHLLPRSRGGRGGPENLAVACRRCNRARRSRAVAAYVRAQLAAGHQPRIDLLEVALRRLGESAAPGHAEYGRRQLALLCGVSEDSIRCDGRASAR
jgi:HNH endonuclease